MGLRSWIINAQVGKRYARLDVENHLREIARSAGLADSGAGMLTAARVDAVATVVDRGVRAFATVGMSAPVWAADDEGAATPSQAGTINLVAVLPVRLSDAALVNAVMTLTEAKTQALLEAGVSGTGTASDATCVLCPAHSGAERFCGPRSLWGARLARAVHGAVARGIAVSGGAR